MHYYCSVLPPQLQCKSCKHEWIDFAVIIQCIQAKCSSPLSQHLSGLSQLNGFLCHSGRLPVSLTAYSTSSVFCIKWQHLKGYHFSGFSTNKLISWLFFSPGRFPPDCSSFSTPTRRAVARARRWVGNEAENNADAADHVYNTKRITPSRHSPCPYTQFTYKLSPIFVFVGYTD